MHISGILYNISHLSTNGESGMKHFTLLLLYELPFSLFPTLFVTPPPRTHFLFCVGQKVCVPCKSEYYVSTTKESRQKIYH